ncbi:hypothetical protein PCASD_19334 [Puccinia coronata f. sp. avenae]|uniref:Wings apart-like protein C-terminal domain-containing protein n=2 Tax=Puccinia coronata f. sp. avenae TaxID=200324 RepID=A0A2N5U1I0_9BASI|nr:hypothetical protein PCASD_19334 [Puccinia coronata f. sp. avenae]
MLVYVVSMWSAAVVLWLKVPASPCSSGASSLIVFSYSTKRSPTMYSSESDSELEEEDAERRWPRASDWKRSKGPSAGLEAARVVLRTGVHFLCRRGRASHPDLRGRRAHDLDKLIPQSRSARNQEWKQQQQATRPSSDAQMLHSAAGGDQANLELLKKRDSQALPPPYQELCTQAPTDPPLHCGPIPSTNKNPDEFELDGSVQSSLDWKKVSGERRTSLIQTIGAGRDSQLETSDRDRNQGGALSPHTTYTQVGLKPHGDFNLQATSPQFRSDSTTESQLGPLNRVPCTPPPLTGCFSKARRTPQTSPQAERALAVSKRELAEVIELLQPVRPTDLSQMGALLSLLVAIPSDTPRSREAMRENAGFLTLITVLASLGTEFVSELESTITTQDETESESNYQRRIPSISIGSDSQLGPLDSPKSDSKSSKSKHSELQEELDAVATLIFKCLALALSNHQLGFKLVLDALRLSNFIPHSPSGDRSNWPSTHYRRQKIEKLFGIVLAFIAADFFPIVCTSEVIQKITFTHERGNRMERIAAGHMLAGVFSSSLHVLSVWPTGQLSNLQLEPVLNQLASIGKGGSLKFQETLAITIVHCFELTRIMDAELLDQGRIELNNSLGC